MFKLIQALKNFFLFKNLKKQFNACFNACTNKNFNSAHRNLEGKKVFFPPQVYSPLPKTSAKRIFWYKQPGTVFSSPNVCLFIGLQSFQMQVCVCVCVPYLHKHQHIIHVVLHIPFFAYHILEIISCDIKLPRFLNAKCSLSAVDFVLQKWFEFYLILIGLHACPEAHYWKQEDIVLSSRQLELFNN